MPLSRTVARCLTLLVLSATTRVFAQPIPKTNPDLGGATTALPPGPTVTDWQPRSRAPVGTKIVITGPAFRPADIEATIGGARLPLPVRLASSTSTRIELDVPASALGQVGPLAISHRGTRGTVLETSYRIDVLTPSIIETTPHVTKTPFVHNFLTFNVKEFTGATVNNDQMTVGGTCAFKKGKVLLGTRTRDADFHISLNLGGWFERAGSCQLELRVTPIAANGSTLPVVTLSRPMSVPEQQRYVFENTEQVANILAPALVHSGLGSTCVANQGAPGATGVTAVGNDLQILVRGGALDVSCTFKTGQIALGDGVRLAEIRWVSNKVGDRCGRAGTFTPTFPSSSFSFTRGSVVVNPDSDQPITEFFAFGDGSVVIDGVTFDVTSGPHTIMLPMIVDLQCVPTTMPLQTSSGTSLPTTSPQSFGVILQRLVLEGPPGLTLSDLMRRR